MNIFLFFSLFLSLSLSLLFFFFFFLSLRLQHLTPTASTHALQEAEREHKAAIEARVSAARAEALQSEQARKLKHAAVMDVQVRPWRASDGGDYL
jgi:sensor histidine kinase regulating citrate/malate metabolism